MIKIDIQSDLVTPVLQRIAQRAERLEPLMGEIAAILHDQAEQNFASESGPLGAWPALKDPARKGGRILQKSGRLAASIAEAHGDDWAQVGTNAVYAAIHQLGGTTRAHEIKPRNKKALAFGGRVVAKVNHPGSNIPARPYLPVYPDGRLQEEAEKSILDALNDYLKSSLDQNGL